jgi:hypothetical protein
VNVAHDSPYAQAKAGLRARLDKHLADTADPRLLADDDRFDRYQYFGGPAEKDGVRDRREPADSESRSRS